MCKLLRLGIILVSVLALSFMLACEGDEGPQGPEGPPGEPGEPGEDLQIAPPDDIYFSLAIFNQFDGTATNYRAHDFLRITFDSTAEPAEDVVVAGYVSAAPEIDGVDGDIDEWGFAEDLFESDVPLEGIVGDDNMISEVSVRCVYDEKYIYFFLTWVEENVLDGPEPSESRNLQEWRYLGFGDEAGFEPTGSEDRVWMMFLTDTSYTPGANDCLLECGLDNATLASAMRIDVWDWRASITDLVGFGDDLYMTYSGGAVNGPVGDAGGAAFMRNIDGDEPAWMHYDDPNENALYPFWFRHAVQFVDDGSFSRNSTIPGYMALIPYGDRANVASMGLYENPRWTVEIRRLRNTGSGNDIQF